ncbi:hypothetical protein PAMP_008252 [Pampus punctatissimus]
MHVPYQTHQCQKQGGLCARLLLGWNQQMKFLFLSQEIVQHMNPSKHCKFFQSVPSGRRRRRFPHD